MLGAIISLRLFEDLAQDMHLASVYDPMGELQLGVDREDVTRRRDVSLHSEPPFDMDQRTELLQLAREQLSIETELAVEALVHEVIGVAPSAAPSRTR